MTRLSGLILATLAAGFVLSPALAAEPFGKWVRPSTGATVDFYNCGGKLCGKIVAVKEWKGSLLDTDNGKTYTGVITLVGADGLNLKGCALGIICEGETWRKVK
jgi:uncharacterized protein (DUF2147 family)